jgi:hypothetical protein
MEQAMCDNDSQQSESRLKIELLQSEIEKNRAERDKLHAEAKSFFDKNKLIIINFFVALGCVAAYLFQFIFPAFDNAIQLEKK